MSLRRKTCKTDRPLSATAQPGRNRFPPGLCLQTARRLSLVDTPIRPTWQPPIGWRGRRWKQLPVWFSHAIFRAYSCTALYSVRWGPLGPPKSEKVKKWVLCCVMFFLYNEYIQSVKISEISEKVSTLYLYCTVLYCTVLYCTVHPISDTVIRHNRVPTWDTSVYLGVPRCTSVYTWDTVYTVSVHGDTKQESLHEVRESVSMNFRAVSVIGAVSIV